MNETLVTHTRTLNDGSVIVVQGVPVRIDVDENGRKENVYKAKTLKQLDALISAKISELFASNSLPPVLTLNFSDQFTPPSASVAFKFNGEKVSLHAALPIWEKAFQKISNAVRVMTQALSKPIGIKPEYPTVKYFAPGSLIIGIEAPSANGLFALDDMPPDIALTALEYTVDLAQWATGTSRMLPESIRNLNAETQVAALKAIEELIPSKGEGIETVEVIPQIGLRTSQAGGQKAILKRENRDRVVTQRIKVQVKHSGKKKFVATGVVHALSAAGELELSEAVLDDKSQSSLLKILASRDLVMHALKYFDQPVTVIGIGTQNVGKKKMALEALDIEPRNANED